MKTPPEVIVPPVAVHVTAGLYAPVPKTVATQVAVCPVVIEEGAAATDTPVTVTAGGVAVTVTSAVSETLVNPDSAECAVQVPVPEPDGVNTPPEVMVPPVAVHVTAVLNAPVPATLATHVAVCDVEMARGAAITVIAVTVGCVPEVAIARDALPDFVGSCAEVA